MKIRLSVFLFLIVSILKAQSFSGYLSDNYSGVHSVLLNPANAASNFLEMDINLLSFDTSLENDFIDVKITDLLKKDREFDFEYRPTINALKENSVFSNIDILAPSVVFKVAENNFSVFTRLRSVFNMEGIDGKLLEELEDDISGDISTGNMNPKMILHNWGEVGITYARTLVEKDSHHLDGGVTLKYLLGMGGVCLSGDAISVMYKKSDDIISSKGELYYFRTDGMFDVINGSFKMPKFKVLSSGIGVDIGIIYKWRPIVKESLSGNIYKIKAGLSITNIGQISYRDNEFMKYNLDKKFDGANYDEEQSFEEFLDKTYPKEKFTEAVAINLPTTLNITIDWNINDSFYFNMEGHLSLKDNKKKGTISFPSKIIFTPRFERKWFSVYSSISYDKYQKVMWGLGGRLGPVFIGSQTVLSNIILKSNKLVNAYVGLKIPIY